MPKKFFRRKDKFLAMQFRASRYEEIRELTRGRLFHDKQASRYLLFTHGHEFIMREGDYIVANNYDDYEVWSEDVFDSLFEIVPGQLEDADSQDEENEGGEA